MDLIGLKLTDGQLTKLVGQTGANNEMPNWTYSDIRARLYPAAIARAFPDRALTFDDLIVVASTMTPSPVVEDR